MFSFLEKKTTKDLASHEKLLEKLATEFKANLKLFDTKLTKLEVCLSSPIDLIYNEHTEITRLIQLDTEETIARIKQSNNLDINADESVLFKIPGMSAKLELIYKQSESMIKRANEHLKEATASYPNFK